MQTFSPHGWVTKPIERLRVRKEMGLTKHRGPCWYNGSGGHGCPTKRIGTNKSAIQTSPIQGEGDVTIRKTSTWIENLLYGG